MKNLFKATIVVITILISAISNAQQTTTSSSTSENSLLWEITGNGLTKSSYLYGTIHMICAEDYFLSEKVKKAFANSEELILEINLSDAKEIQDMQKMAMGKESLNKILNPDQLFKLDQILKNTAAMNIDQVNGFSLTAVMSLVSMKAFGCSDFKLYEMEFMKLAKKNNIEIKGFETVKSQLAIIDGAYTNDEMITMLGEITQNNMSKLVDDYKSENISLMYDKMVDKQQMNQHTKEQMLDIRNQNWVKILPKLMDKKAVFVAVGAAHLAGEFGVINLLRKAGYVVNPIMK